MIESLSLPWLVPPFLPQIKGNLFYYLDSSFWLPPTTPRRQPTLHPERRIPWKSLIIFSTPRSSRYFRSVLPSLRSLITFHRSEEPTGDHMGKESDEWAWSVHIMKENKTKKQWSKRWTDMPHPFHRSSLAWKWWLYIFTLTAATPFPRRKGRRETGSRRCGHTINLWT